MIARVHTSTRQLATVLVAVLCCLLSVCVGWAAAAAAEDEGTTANPFLVPPGSLEAVHSAEVGPTTDENAAKELPHTDLGREEAETLLAAVFPTALAEASGIFQHLNIDEFHSDHVAVVSPDGSPGLSGLLSSTLPLRAEDASGEKELVDLGLERAEGELEPTNPLVPVEIPDNLEDGISLPEIGVAIELSSGQADRSASTIADEAAFYPSVATDTDLSVVPTPTGVETFTQLRSPQAPQSQTFHLTMPSGAQLKPNSDGGADVSEGEEQLLTIAPPSAIDAEGNAVPVSLDVAGDSLTLQIDPGANAAYPILLDPVYESYSWANTGNNTGIYSDWRPYSSNEALFKPSIIAIWNETMHDYLGLNSYSGAISPGTQASWNYYVPRYFSDYEDPALHVRPTTFIRNMTLGQVYFNIEEEPVAHAQPYLQYGIWDENKGAFVSAGMHNSQEGAMTNATINLPNPQEVTDAKNGGIALASYESLGYNRRALVGSATVELSDKDSPSFGSLSSPSSWMNGTATSPLEYVVSDPGLGIYSFNLSQPQASGGLRQIITSNGCTGIASNPCPRTAKTASRTIAYDPKTMPQGEDRLSIIASDPVNHQSTAGLVRVKVDHTAPGLALSGNLTEQGTAGTKLPSYTLNYNASDGEEGEASALAPIGYAGSPDGQFGRPEGLAVDTSGNVWASDLSVSKRLVELDKTGHFLRQVNSHGSGDGQVNEPRGLTIGSNGNLWVAEAGNKRLQAFSPTGAFVGKITNAAFVEPYGIASGPEGTLWVSDPGAHKLFQFKEDGTLLRTIVSKPNEAVLSAPFGIAVDSLGDVWVAEQSSNKIYEYSPTGAFVFSFGGEGTGNGQFKAPSGLTFAPSGNLFVSDEGSRVQEFKPDGTFLRQFGTLGSASDQFKEPRALALAPDRTLLVADAGNRRVDPWTHADQDPQSGAAKVVVKVDGTAAKTESPGCATKNCQINSSWTLNADNYAVGAHKVEVIATDGVGLTTTKALNVETHGDLVAPTIALSGSMTQQASLGTTLPSYKLKAAATDPGAAEERKSGVASETIKVDGKVVDTTSPGCPAEGCSITREWTLSSSSYSVGSHNVEVLATDVAGHTTTKTLSITIERDTTAPALNTPGAVYSAPEGWLEQKSYSYLAIATDPGGYGATSLQLKVDGSVIKTSSNTCSEGGCSRILEGQINMANYSGGAHPAELIATDGAGNVRKKTWTINVDPDGHITVSEATDTLEAVEATAPEVTELTPVPGIVANVVGEDGLDPQLVPAEGTFTSEGTLAPSTVSVNPENGFSVETTAETAESTVRSANVSIAPTQLNPEATNATPTDGSAAVISNSSANVDTILRPAYDGVMQFQAIRDATAPEAYSWKVALHEGEALELIDSQHAGIYWADGTEALLITAEAAHGADGEAIPTTLSVSEGNVITLTVHHRASGVVYPVVAGIGWDGGFQTYPATVEEEREPTFETVTEPFLSAPPEVYPSDSSDPCEAGEACASWGPPPYKYLRKFGARQCEKGTRPVFDGCSIWEMKIRGFFWYNGQKVWETRKPTCLPDGSLGIDVNPAYVCEWVGPTWQKYGGGHHITAQDLYSVTYAKIATTKQHHLSIYAYGDGYWNDHDTDCVCNPLPKEE